MAGFKTHITTSTVLGIGYGAAAFGVYQVPWPTCAVAAGLCSVSGMLPDLDSGPGRPLRESMAFAAAVIPLFLMHRLQSLGLTHEELILVGAAVYCLVRFGGTALLQAVTVHRGMFHSLPAAAIFGEAAFLLASGDDVNLRIFKAGGVVLGYLTHLVLDEIWAVEWKGVRLRFKSSFGTALKFFGSQWLPNLAVIVQLAVLTWAVTYEPNWFNDLRRRRDEQWAQRHAQPFSAAPATAAAGPASRTVGGSLPLVPIATGDAAAPGDNASRSRPFDWR